jgi:hypothetical protein
LAVELVKLSVDVIVAQWPPLTVQWTYFVTYLKKLFEMEVVKNAVQLAAAGNESKTPEGDPPSKGQ